MDFSKIENIIFVSAIGALIVMFLASTIAVIAKGKRKATAWDIVLRVLSSIVFVASIVLVAMLVLTQLKGDYRIDISSDPALYWGSFVCVLPVPALFVSLGTLLGASLVTGITVTSFVALLSDCLIANQKVKKSNETIAPVQAQPEDNGGVAEVDVNDAAVGAANRSATADGKANESAEEYEHSKTQSETVNQTTLPTSEELSPEQEETPWYADDGGFDIDDDKTEEQRDDAAWYAESDIVVPSDERTESVDDNAEEESGDTAETNPFDTATDVPQEYESVADENAQDSDEYDKSYETPEEAEMTEETETSAEPENISVQERETTDYIDEDIEPDRDIYIPKMRTVARGDKTNSGTAAKRRNATAKSKSAKSANSVPAKTTQAANGAKNRTAEKTENKANLPVNRRYVIIDRHSAVNIFSNYLKDRDKQDKEKLESSISKVIIK